MIRHIVTWNYGDGFTPEENKDHVQKMKEGFDELLKLIPEIKELKLIANELSTSTIDLMLDTKFESEETLATYQANEDHQKLGAYVKTVTKNRQVFDYSE